MVFPGKHEEEATVRGVHIDESNARRGVVRRKHYVDSAGPTHSAFDWSLRVFQMTQLIGEWTSAKEYSATSDFELLI